MSIQNERGASCGLTKLRRQVRPARIAHRGHAGKHLRRTPPQTVVPAEEFLCRRFIQPAEGALTDDEQRMAQVRLNISDLHGHHAARIHHQVEVLAALAHANLHAGRLRLAPQLARGLNRHAGADSGELFLELSSEEHWTPPC
jgi:hypothetical protein